MTYTLIDRHLPRYQVRSQHQVDIDASIHDIYPLVRGLDFSGSAIIRVLFTLRGIRLKNYTLFSLMQDQDFVLLDENPPHEFVVGFGYRHKRCGNSRKRNFLGIQKRNYQIAWNFSIQRGSEQNTLKTETRVQCLSNKALIIFRVYWFLIGPFSGLIRRIVLLMVKKRPKKFPQKKQTEKYFVILP